VADDESLVGLGEHHLWERAIDRFVTRLRSSPARRIPRRHRIAYGAGWSHRGDSSMGFWGIKVLIRTASDLMTVPVLTELLGGELDSAWNESTGWVFASLHQADYPDVTQVIALAEAVNGPVLTAYVADSDCAILQFASPGTAPHWGVLHAETALEMGFDGVPSAHETYAHLAEWAGGPLDETAVTEALTTELIFAEDTFLVLAHALGALEPESLPDRVFGSLDPHE
jgi:hypothetical protein